MRHALDLKSVPFSPRYTGLSTWPLLGNPTPNRCENFLRCVSYVLQRVFVTCFGQPFQKGNRCIYGESNADFLLEVRREGGPHYSVYLVVVAPLAKRRYHIYLPKILGERVFVSSIVKIPNMLPRSSFATS